MNQTIKCIFCLNNAEPSEEHVIPDSVGGRLTICEVCKECNSSLSKNIDGPFSNFWYIRLVRYALQIGGKRGKIPFPFDGVGSEKGGAKVVVSRDLHPYILSDVTSTPDEQGNTNLRVTLDARDQNRASDVLQNRLRKALAEHNPTWTREKVDEEIEGIIAQVQEIAPSSSRQPIQQQKVMNLPDWAFEALKIAYEAWFRHFGYEWIETSTTAAMIRSAIMNRDITQRIHGGFGNLPLSALLPRDSHAIILLNGACHVSLFGLGYNVICEETDSRFMLEQDRSRIIYQEAAERPVQEMSLLEYVGSRMKL